jgi:uncharacterized membrane protein SpoIIM required for sporulation
MIGWRSYTLDATLILMITGSVLYLRRVTMPRPPIGRFTSGDIAVMSVMLIVLPVAYLRLPAVAVSAVFGVVLFTAAQMPRRVERVLALKSTRQEYFLPQAFRFLFVVIFLITLLFAITSHSTVFGHMSPFAPAINTGPGK